jgi:hypothetical protein
VSLRELAPRLWRWTAIHPDADPNPEPGSPADWPAEVGCVAYAAPDALVLVDPLVVEDRWAPLDAVVERLGLPVFVLTTLRFHRRSREAVAARYGATLRGYREAPPSGVARVPIERGDESMVWLEGPRALVPGDRLLGDGSGGLRVCPESWLRYLPDPPTIAELKAAMRPLLDLPVEMVLVSHGEPVLENGHEALARALAAD